MNILSNLIKVAFGTISVTYHGVAGAVNTVVGNEEKGAEHLGVAADKLGRFCGDIKHRVDNVPKVTGANAGSFVSKFKAAYSAASGETKKGANK